MVSFIKRSMARVEVDHYLFNVAYWRCYNDSEKAPAYDTIDGLRDLNDELSRVSPTSISHLSLRKLIYILEQAAAAGYDVVEFTLLKD